MKFTEIFDESKISRRKLLQGMGAIATVATVSGCSTDDESLTSSLTPGDNLVFDTSLKQHFSTGAYNCGGRCVHKVHVKNGRILKFTSCGDTERDAVDTSESVGENGIPIQHRACVRGYSYVQRLYQPDKLKYPLMQMGTRGDVNGFQRVTWDRALDAAAQAIKNAADRRATLGYSPIMTKWHATAIGQFSYFADPKVAPCIHFVGNESTGAVDAAKWDAVGADGVTNNMADRLNSQFIITWGLDPSRVTYHVAHAHWYNTVAKERNIPIVSITTNCNDSASMIATGVPNHTYAVNGTSKTVDIPAWIPCRPATDGALAAAMAYVIYKNAWYDADYVGTDAADATAKGKTFGFWPAQTITSTAPGGAPVSDGSHRHTSVPSAHTFGHKKNLKSPAQFTDEAGNVYEKGDSYKGAQFTVPTGESFSEYLDSLEVEWGGAVAGDEGNATAGDAVYDAVLNYVERLTGVKSDIIEALANKYATAKSADGAKGAFLDVGGGPQRAWNGLEWTWFMIALTTMTGNIDKPGGGAGYSMMAHADVNAIGLNPAFTGGVELAIMSPSSMLADCETANGIFIPMNEWSHLVLTGKDRRTRQQVIDDVKVTTAANADGAVDLSTVGANDKLIEVDVWILTENNILTTAENINKNIEAIKEIPTVIIIDQVMSPTVLYSTIVLPAASHYEKASVEIQVATTALYAREKVIDVLYDTKTDNTIKKELYDRFNTLIGTTVNTSGLADASEITEASIAAFVPSSVYKASVDANASYSFDDLMSKGTTEIIIPPEKSLVAFRDFPHCVPGNLENTTGKINFYSPLWGQIRPKRDYVAPAGAKDAAGNDIAGDTFYNGFRNATCKYEPHIEGYEKFFENNDPRNNFVGYKSRFYEGNYGLYYMTNKARNRAHTVLDNVGVIKNEFEQSVILNPIDASSRGINNGDMVYVYNDRGCTKIPAQVTQQIPPGVISVEHGAWYRAHPTEKIKVMIQTGVNEAFVEKTVPVDVGGAENVLTLDIGTSEIYVGQATNAQGGPCEVSLTLPSDRRA